jgi:glycosyltransferase involved in cell wall biosynthesis
MHVVLLLNNPYTGDSRSWKLASSLAARGDEVTVVARTGPALPADERRDGARILRVEQPRTLAWLPAPGLPPAASGGTPARRSVRDRVGDSVGRGAQAGRYLVRTRDWAAAIGAALDAVGTGPVDIWQSEGLVTLPVALRLRARRGGRVVYDSRDIHLESARFARLPGPWRRLLADRERRWARSADALVTVNEPYAEHLARAFGRTAEIVFNGPLPFDPPDPPEHRFHDRLGLDPSCRVVVAVGAVVAHRGIEQATEAIGAVPDAVLVVVGDGSAKARIVAEAAALPHADRVHFVDGLPPADLLPWTAAADVALMPIQPSTLNHRLTTPTRLFDAMGAGVPVVASDLPGMAAIVRETGIGVLVDPTDPADIARGLRAIMDASPEVRAGYRGSALAAARGRYAWAAQVDRLAALYARLLGT